MPPGRPRKNNDDVLLKSAEVLGWAVGGIEREIAQTRERLATLMSQAAALRTRAGGGGAAKSGAPAAAPAQPTASVAATAEETAAGRKRRRRKMSAEARRRISENLKKRWAETKKAGKTRLQASSR